MIEVSVFALPCRICTPDFPSPLPSSPLSFYVRARGWGFQREMQAYADAMAKEGEALRAATQEAQVSIWLLSCFYGHMLVANYFQIHLVPAAIAKHHGRNQSAFVTWVGVFRVVLVWSSGLRSDHAVVSFGDAGFFLTQKTLTPPHPPPTRPPLSVFENLNSFVVLSVNVDRLRLREPPQPRARPMLHWRASDSRRRRPG